MNIALPMVLLSLVQEDWGTNLMALQSMAYLSTRTETEGRHLQIISMVSIISLTVLRIRLPGKIDKQRELMTQLGQALATLVISIQVVKLFLDALNFE